MCVRLRRKLQFVYQTAYAIIMVDRFRGLTSVCYALKRFFPKMFLIHNRVLSLRFFQIKSLLIDLEY